MRNLPQIAASKMTKKVRYGAGGDTKRKSEGAAAALGVGGSVKQEPSRLTLIYFGSPVSGLASAGGAANWRHTPGLRAGGRPGVGDSWDGRACSRQGAGDDGARLAGRRSWGRHVAGGGVESREVLAARKGDACGGRRPWTAQCDGLDSECPAAACLAPALAPRACPGLAGTCRRAHSAPEQQAHPA